MGATKAAPNHDQGRAGSKLAGPQVWYETLKAKNYINVTLLYYLGHVAIRLDHHLWIHFHSVFYVNAQPLVDLPSYFKIFATLLPRSRSTSGSPEPSSGRRYEMNASVTPLPAGLMSSSSITRVLPATVSSGISG
jgi:hypothetical protein